MGTCKFDEAERIVDQGNRTYRAMLGLGLMLLAYSATRWAYLTLPAWVWPVAGWVALAAVVLSVLAVIVLAVGATLNEVRADCDYARRQADAATASAAAAWRELDAVRRRVDELEGRADATSRACSDLMRDSDKARHELGRTTWAAREALLGVRQLAESRGLAVIVNEGPAPRNGEVV